MDDLLLNDVYENFCYLKKQLAETQEDNEILVMENKDLKNQVEELESSVRELENAPIEEPIDLDEVEDKIINAIEWRFMRHPNPDQITLPLVIVEIKDAIKSFSY